MSSKERKLSVLSEGLLYFSTFDNRRTCRRKPARELLVQMRLINKLLLQSPVLDVLIRYMLKKMQSFSSREALLSVSQNFFEEVDLGAGDVKVRTLYFKITA